MTKSNFLSLQRQMIIALSIVAFAYNRSNQEYLKLQNLESDFFVNQVGYFNLSCPFEMAKLSCEFLKYGGKSHRINAMCQIISRVIDLV